MSLHDPLGVHPIGSSPHFGVGRRGHPDLFRFPRFDATKHFSVKTRAFQWKGGDNSVNGWFGKDFYRKGNSVKTSGRFNEPPDSENWKLQSLSPSRKSALILSAFYKTLPSKNPSKNLVLYWKPLQAPSKNPSKKHLLLENLLRNPSKSRVLLHDPLGVHPTEPQSLFPTLFATKSLTRLPEPSATL